MAEPGPESDQNTEPKVQYVLSGQLTGMAAMANAVREYDEEQVQNCKEDIDTLLVFVRSWPTNLTFPPLTRWIGWLVLCGSFCIPPCIILFSPA